MTSMTRARGVVAILLLSIGAAFVPVDHVSAKGLLGEVYVSKSMRVPNHERRTLTVACPKGRPVLSGGTYVTGSDISLEVASNGPVDGPDRNRKPDDAWLGSISNDSGESQKMIVTAQCGRRSDRAHLEYVRFSRDLFPGGESKTGQTCSPGFSLVGGGLVASGNTRNAPLLGSWPFDTDLDGTRDDAWLHWIRNGSSKKIRLSYTSICADFAGAFTSAQATGNIAAQTQGPLTVTCPSVDQVAFGGGGWPEDTTVNLATLRMNPTSNESIDGWTMWMNNTGFATKGIDVATVCFEPDV
jgi:hypothetical protein